MSGNSTQRGRGSRGRGTTQPPPPGLSQQRPPAAGPSTSSRPQAQAPPARLPPRDPNPRPQSHAADVGAGDMSRLRIAANGGGLGDLARGAKRGRKVMLCEDAPINTKPATCLTKQGREGQSIQLCSNYFSLKVKADYEIYQYRVDFSDPEDRVPVRNAWLKQHQAALGERWLFDGTMLFSTVAFARPDKPLNLTSFKKDSRDPVEITIKYATKFDNSNSQIVQLFNLILRRCMGMLNLTLVGRRLFDAMAPHEIREHRIVIWPGYDTSIRQHEHQFLLNCEFISKVMRMETAYDLLKDNPRDFVRNIVSTSVITSYNNTMYRIDDVDQTKSPLSTFEQNGRMITFVEYYRTRYNINIRDTKQPLLISRPKGKDIRGGRTNDALLIPELCNLTGLTDSMRANFKLMKAMSEVVHISPANRIARLQTFNKRLLGTPEIKNELKAWGLELSTELVECKGRQRPAETLVFGNKVSIHLDANADWTRGSENKAMYICAPLREWFVICASRQENDTRNFVKTMRQLAGKMNFNMPEPEYVITRSDAAPEMVRAIEEILARADPAMLFITLSNVNADRYSAIKKKCYIDRGISSQVVTQRVLTNRNIMTIASKVAIQINTKLGGSPWTVQMPNMGAMIVGFDVCHDPIARAKSCGAMVATSNPQMTSYYNSTTFHTEGEELSNTFGAQILAAVRHWQRHNNDQKPTRIIIYRDGVGDGQIKHVHDHELASVQKALSKAYGETLPPIVYIIVTKRINTRLFVKNTKSNPEAGVVVDDVITLPEKYDFYMVSQKTKQGSVMPTCYNIIADTSGWGSDRLQRLTFMLSHLYYNLSATVRVPAVVQYAHRLAFLVSQSLHAEPNPALNDRLFFI